MDEYLTTDELCDKFKVTRRTIERWRTQGLPFSQLGRSVRFDEKAVKEWVAQNSHKQVPKNKK